MTVHPSRYSTTAVQQPKRLIVVHTSESGDGSMQNLINIMATPGTQTVPGSNPPRLFGSAYHAVADGTTGDYVQLLPGSAGPYANGGANKFAWSICCPGRASQTRDEWLDPMSRGQIKAVAKFIVDKAKADGIPLERVSPPQMIDGAKGYCGHVDVTYTWHQSTHTDPGPNFPWDVLADDIRALTNPIPPIPQPPMEDGMIPLNPPARVYDSRQSTPFAAGETREIPVSMGGRAAALNITVTAPQAKGHVTVWTDGDVPPTSNVNFDAGETIANHAIVALANSSVKVRPTVACHIIIDTQAVWE